jgi:hypothetical protein
MRSFFKKKKGPKSTRQRLVARCKYWWSKVVHATQGDRCQRCKYSLGQCAHHVIVRQTAIKAWWFDPSYGVWICSKCHNDAHSVDVDRQIEFRDWVKAWLLEQGRDYDKMKVLARMPSGVKDFDLGVIKDSLKKQFAQNN